MGSESVRIDRVSQRLGGKGRPTPAHSSPGTGRSSQTTYQIECGPAGSGRICCRWRLRRHRCSVLWGPRSSGWIGSVTASASSRPGTGRSSHTTYHCLCIITESTSCRGCRRLCGHCCMNLRGTRASGMTGSVTWQTKRSTRSRAAAARRREGARSKREGKRAASTFRRFCGNRYLRNVVTQGILLLRAVTHAFLGASEGALDPGVLRSACAGAVKQGEIERGDLLANRKCQVSSFLRFPPDRKDCLVRNLSQQHLLASLRS